MDRTELLLEINALLLAFILLSDIIGRGATEIFENYAFIVGYIAVIGIPLHVAYRLIKDPSKKSSESQSQSS